MIFTKVPKVVWIILSAFFGGTTLSLLDLASNPTGISFHFMIGAVAAGLVGIGGYIVAGNTHPRSAFVSGIAGPNIIGGLLKAGTTVVEYMLPIAIVPIVLAGDMPEANNNTNRIELNIEGTNNKVKVTDIHTGKVYLIDSNNPITIPFSDLLEVEIDNVGTQIITVDNDYIVDSTKRLNVIVLKKQRTWDFLRGFLPLQQESHNPLARKFKVIEVEQKKSETEKDSVVQEQIPNEGHRQ